MGKTGSKRFDWREFDKTLRPFVKPKAPIPEWDDYFSATAVTASTRSKDESRRVGAVIVNDDQVILSTGYNWLPRGVKELSERIARKSEKYKWITHAETNAIFNAARTGISLVGATIYASTFPCSACAQAIVQSGITRVFTHGEFWSNDPNGYEKALEIFAEAHILVDAPAMRKLDHKCRKMYWSERAKKKATRKVANDNDGRPVSKPRKTRGLGEKRHAAKRGASKPGTKKRSR